MMMMIKDTIVKKAFFMCFHSNADKGCIKKTFKLYTNIYFINLYQNFSKMLKYIL